jgi:hypothetical protein
MQEQINHSNIFGYGLFVDWREISETGTINN